MNSSCSSCFYKYLKLSLKKHISPFSSRSPLDVPCLNFYINLRLLASCSTYTCNQTTIRDHYEKYMIVILTLCSSTYPRVLFLSFECSLFVVFLLYVHHGAARTHARWACVASTRSCARGGPRTPRSTGLCRSAYVHRPRTLCAALRLRL